MEYHRESPLRHMGELPSMGAHRYGEKTAFSFHGRELSYAELEARANRVANVLTGHGVEPGDRIGLFVPNTLQFPVSYFGMIKTGAVPVPLNLRMDPETLAFVLEDSGADRVIASPLLADEAQELAAAAGVGTLFLPGVNAEEPVHVVNMSHATVEAAEEFETVDRAFDDVACQVYTSGTTGRPKGVLLSHRNLLSAVESYDKSGLAVDPEDSILLVLPMFHIYALNAMMAVYLYTGASMMLQAEPEPEPMLRALDDHGITKFAGVPAIYTMMFQEYREHPEQYDLSTLEDVICAAAPLPDETRRTIEDAWGVPMVEGWGMTETAPAGTLEPVRGVRKRASCVGPPVRDIELKLVDPATRETIAEPDGRPRGGEETVDEPAGDAPTGEIAVRGPQVCEGYYNRPEANAEAFDDEGWFYTGDIARLDADGYFWMVDRADDMLIVGGENVYPAEVEDVLYEHPDVAEAAVVAAPHEVKGEAPVAFVVSEAGSELTERELREFAIGHVATYAHPRRVFFVEELPRSATQKVQRYRLEERAEELLEGPLAATEGEL